jgi:hypothetical protein
MTNDSRDRIHFQSQPGWYNFYPLPEILILLRLSLVQDKKISLMFCAGSSRWFRVAQWTSLCQKPTIGKNILLETYCKHMEDILMALTQVARYYSRWDMDNHDGRIALYDAGNSLLDNRVFSNPDEFQVIVGLLRYEQPLWFDDASKHLRTGFGINGEPVGEEENV